MTNGLYHFSPSTPLAGAFFNYQRLEGGLDGCGGAPVSARTLMDSVLLRFTKESFTNMQQTEPKLAMQLLLAIIRQVHIHPVDEAFDQSLTFSTTCVHAQPSTP